jgi:4-aminobutyrate aminotransferase
MSRGLSFKTTMGNVLTWTPPLITTREQMAQALQILEQCLQEVAKP